MPEPIVDDLALDLEIRRSPQPGLMVRVATPGGEVPLRVASFG